MVKNEMWNVTWIGYASVIPVTNTLTHSTHRCRSCRNDKSDKEKCSVEWSNDDDEQQQQKMSSCHKHFHAAYIYGCTHTHKHTRVRVWDEVSIDGARWKKKGWKSPYWKDDTLQTFGNNSKRDKCKEWRKKCAGNIVHWLRSARLSSSNIVSAHAITHIRICKQKRQQSYICNAFRCCVHFVSATV